MGGFMKQIVTYILLFLLTSCGTNYHLKKSKYHELKAISKGADLKTDTVKTHFKFDGAKANFKWDIILNKSESRRPVLNDTTIFINKIKVQKKDSLIYIECPDNEGEVPTTITKEIQTGAGFWDIFKIVIFSVVLTALLVTFYWKVAK